MVLNFIKIAKSILIIINMKYLLFFIFCALQVSAETYTVRWQKNDQVQHYSMDILCVETGFSTFKKYSKTTTSADIELAQNQTYQIILYASSKNRSLIPSNTLIIRTSKIKLNSRIKAPQISAFRKQKNEKEKLDKVRTK